LPYWLTARQIGYERAMREAGLAPLPPSELPPITVPDADERRFRLATRTFAGHLFEPLQGAQGADALMVHTDGDALICAAACRLLGRRVHEDVTIVGYDNYWRESPLRRLTPEAPAATVDKLNRQIGAELVRVLLEHDAAPATPILRLVKPRLVTTAETEAPAARSE
jgi:DNA-binding LacI/PurR family transcriptional regulator